MNNSIDFNPYWHYLLRADLQLDLEERSRLAARLAQTNWDEPDSPLDWNNRAVVMLAEASLGEDVEQRFEALRLASEWLNQGGSHPLCVAHLALISCMTGQASNLSQYIFSRLIESFHAADHTNPSSPPGLIYLPLRNHPGWEIDLLRQILRAEDSCQQAILLLNEVFCRSNLAFYNSGGMRSCSLAVQLSPNSAHAHLKLGIAHLLNDQLEGVFNLQQARKLAPGDPAILHSLYLTYRQRGQIEIAQFWLKVARDYAWTDPTALPWDWTTLDLDSPWTYVPYDQGIRLAVEPSFASIVTGVLLAEGDWFEQEMEFWRCQIQPGMTVIDVGANVGVYTFSAAQRVGSTGRVLAVEPFGGCVQCLTQTRQVNQMEWVTVCSGAASDRNGSLKLSLSGSSELNRIVQAEAEPSQSGVWEEVPCFRLDSLVEQEKLERVDFLKIDAEGHELQVLTGSEQLLETFAPTILYENMLDQETVNLPVADFLQARGYQLFRYHPFIQQISPILSREEMQGNLNIIAIHPTRQQG
ncbi:FkbM family methyltransferase [Leptothermofonsia sichuanensis E412]|uniref:FkbM family methyltransferase n=1 Tax=Leptothermofonsia sichuanensis TaxID=2917832 RepID=UPI001CA77636|nr:FkbM family methyltransferase [Leptothermofonsia sichuanensis]QZZ21936.1 FkbM family methyltransferase [Leptothermofonsia sichuanensis E412]